MFMTQNQDRNDSENQSACANRYNKHSLTSIAIGVAFLLNSGTVTANASFEKSVQDFQESITGFRNDVEEFEEDPEFDESEFDFEGTAIEFDGEESEFDESTDFDEAEDQWLTPTIGYTPEIDAPDQLNHCEGLITHSEPVIVSPINQPGQIELFLDPSFQTRTRRLTNSTYGEVIKPINNGGQSWSADESLLILQRYRTGKPPTYILLDGNTYQEIGNLNIPAVANNAIYWSQENPFSLMFVTDSDSNAGQLTRLDIASGSSEVVKDFEPYCEELGFTSRGGIFTKPSAKDELFGYQCGASANKSVAISYRYSSDEVHTINVGEGTSWKLGEPPIASASGNSFWFQGKNVAGTFEPVANESSIEFSSRPISVGTNNNYEDKIYQVANKKLLDVCQHNSQGEALAVERDSRTGNCEALVSADHNYVLPPEGTNIFSGSDESRNWLALASVGYGAFENFTNKKPAPAYFSEIFLMDKTNKDDVKVCRLGHHRTFGKEAKNASYLPALGEPDVILSPSGTRVLFSSDWYDSGSVNTYVIELLTFSRLRLDGEWVDNKRPNMITRFAQTGAKFNFSRSIVSGKGQPALVTSGTGSILGRQINLDYTTKVANKSVPGKCTASIKNSVDFLEFECDNEHLGDSKIDIVRQ